MQDGGKKTVAVVDDDQSMRAYLRETLTSGGYECRTFPNSSAAITWLAADECVDLMLSDINMPGMSGLDLLRTVKTITPHLPFILISGLCDLPLATRALRAGATDYLLKPVRPADLLGLVSKHLEVSESEQLEVVRGALKRLLSSEEKSGANLERDLVPIFDVLGCKRFETLQHSRRVAGYSVLIAREMGMDRASLRSIEIGALLHDIGKAGIPQNVLMKPGKLTKEEWAIMEMHPRLGLDLLSGMPGLHMESQIVSSHHERFDGMGYPQRLAGKEIPLGARVFSVADTLDALTSDRCYRPGRPLPEARVEIRLASGTQFDPTILKSFDRIPDQEIEVIRRKFPDLP